MDCLKCDPLDESKCVKCRNPFYEGKCLPTKTVFRTGRAFAALKKNGDLVVWGDSNYGGDTGNKLDGGNFTQAGSPCPVGFFANITQITLFLKKFVIYFYRKLYQ